MTEQQQEFETIEGFDINDIMELPEDDINKILGIIRKFMLTLDGKNIEDDSVTLNLTDPKEILERTRFTTFPLLQKNVYLRIVAKHHPELTAFKHWADIEAKALLSYKGESRKEWVEIKKAAQIAQPTQLFNGYSPTHEQQTTQKKRFWQRTPKTESEFKNQ